MSKVEFKNKFSENDKWVYDMASQNSGILCESDRAIIFVSKGLIVFDGEKILVQEMVWQDMTMFDILKTLNAKYPIELKKFIPIRPMKEIILSLENKNMNFNNGLA